MVVDNTEGHVSDLGFGSERFGESKQAGVQEAHYFLEDELLVSLPTLVTVVVVEVAEVPGELGNNSNVVSVHYDVHHDNEDFLVELPTAWLIVGSQTFLEHQH